MKTSRVLMYEQGGPEVMQLEEADLGAPDAGEVQIEQTAIGLNSMDIYQRSGTYKMALPSPLGLEAAGHVLAIRRRTNHQLASRVAAVVPGISPVRGRVRASHVDVRRDGSLHHPRVGRGRSDHPPIHVHCVPRDTTGGDQTPRRNRQRTKLPT